MKKINLGNLKRFESNSRAIKLYNAVRWWLKTPCPLRFTVNPYKTCSLKCKYCYSRYNWWNSIIKEWFRKSFDKDIEKAVKLWLNNLVVEIAPSVELFQNIELDIWDSLYVLQKLLVSWFKVVLVTKNPWMLFHEKYKDLLVFEKLFIDVTIASSTEGNKDSIFTYSWPSYREKLDVIKTLIAIWKQVRIKIEPIIPITDQVLWQSLDDIKTILEDVQKLGVKKIISKTIRINKELPIHIYNKLIWHFTLNGYKEGENYILNNDSRRKLLQPVFDWCKSLWLEFCPCCDDDVFDEKDVTTCLITGEINTKMLEIQPNIYKKKGVLD